MNLLFRRGETPEHLAGIIPRAVKEIFEEISRRKEELSVSVSVAFVELYREQVSVTECVMQ